MACHRIANYLFLIYIHTFLDTEAKKFYRNLKKITINLKLKFIVIYFLDHGIIYEHVIFGNLANFFFYVFFRNKNFETFY